MLILSDWLTGGHIRGTFFDHQKAEKAMLLIILMTACNPYSDYEDDAWSAHELQQVAEACHDECSARPKFVYPGHSSETEYVFTDPSGDEVGRWGMGSEPYGTGMGAIDEAMRRCDRLYTTCHARVVEGPDGVVVVEFSQSFSEPVYACVMGDDVKITYNSKC